MWPFRKKEQKCRHYKGAGQKLSNMVTVYSFSPYAKDSMGYGISQCSDCGVRAFSCCAGIHGMSDRQAIIVDLYINYKIGPYDFEKFLTKEMAWWKGSEP